MMVDDVTALRRPTTDHPVMRAARAVDRLESVEARDLAAHSASISDRQETLAINVLLENVAMFSRDRFTDEDTRAKNAILAILREGRHASEPVETLTARIAPTHAPPSSVVVQAVTAALAEPGVSEPAIAAE